MADNSKIEWTDATFNPVTGCTEVSEGCDRCYAKTFAERWRGIPGHYFENGFDVQLRPDKLALPLKWRKPRTVFVNSMSDLFHADIPDAYIAKVFAVMAATPQHVYQVLTKRHGRMRALLNSPAFLELWDAEFLDLTVNRYPHLRVERWGWPLPNVHLGVSVENQDWAEVRVPALLATPAAVRFLSCEPLLGPIDLSAWMPPISPMPPVDAPATWADWGWPEWVPAEVRSAIEGFWGDRIGRGPRAWLRSMREQHAPAFGSTVTLPDGFATGAPRATGRFVFAWNNIGRLIMPDGTFKYTSFGETDQERQRGLGWVITGAESSAGARVMDLDWVRALRDQCVAANVPFFYKQDAERGKKIPTPELDGKVWVQSPRRRAAVTAGA